MGVSTVSVAQFHNKSFRGEDLGTRGGLLMALVSTSQPVAK